MEAFGAFDGSSNLPRATNTKPQAILNVLIHLHSRGYAESTLKGLSKKLKHLNRHANLANPDSVLKFINSKSNPNTKNLLANAYNNYAKYHKISWEKPVYRKSESPIKVPTEENIDHIIDNVLSLKRKVAYGILKDTGIRPIELHNLKLENIDLERGLIYIRSAKHGNPRTLKLKTQTLANFKTLVVRKEYALSQQLFASPDRLSMNWREERTRAYGRTGNPEFLKIRLYDLRHYYATKLYSCTKDLLRVKINLGHKNIQNTVKYTHMVAFKDDEYHSATASTVKEACKLIEIGYEYVTELEGIKIFRKRK
jgi:integrase